MGQRLGGDRVAAREVPRRRRPRRRGRRSTGILRASSCTAKSPPTRSPPRLAPIAARTPRRSPSPATRPPRRPGTSGRRLPGRAVRRGGVPRGRSACLPRGPARAVSRANGLERRSTPPSATSPDPVTGWGGRRASKTRSCQSIRKIRTCSIICAQLPKTAKRTRDSRWSRPHHGRPCDDVGARLAGGPRSAADAYPRAQRTDVWRST